MERERTQQRPPADSGGPPAGDDLDSMLAGASDLLSTADRILDTLRPVDAEDFLLQNRQQGGQ